MRRVLITCNRNETSTLARELRFEFSRQPFEFAFGADTLLLAGEDPATQLNRVLTRFSALVVILGPIGFDPYRPVELLAIRLARNLDLKLILVLTDGATPDAELADLPQIHAKPGDEIQAICEQIAILIPCEQDSSNADAASLGDADHAADPGILMQEEIDVLLSMEDRPDDNRWRDGVREHDFDLHSPGDLPEPDDELFAAAAIAGSDPSADVGFSAYLPGQIIPARRQSLLVYAHLVDEPHILRQIEADVERFRDELGGESPVPRHARDHIRLRPGTAITVLPECPDLEFDPPELTKRWQGDWTRFVFDVHMPAAARPGELALVRVAVLVAGIEVAHINCAAELGSSNNPLAAARDLERHQARLYQRIFISYSRRDWEITRAYHAAQLALGNEIFLDSESIRAGENWQAALALGIAEADIMQLFWSVHSARSANVHDEWDYALKHRCPADRCANFIRPVYWKEPAPSPPPELAHLHFRLVRLP